MLTQLLPFFSHADIIEMHYCAKTSCVDPCVDIFHSFDIGDTCSKMPAVFIYALTLNFVL